MKNLKKYPVAWLIAAVVVAASILFGVKMAKSDMVTVTPGNWVCDGADVLSDETEQAVRTANASFDQNYSAYVAVVTVPSLKGWDADAYAEKLFNSWELYGNDFMLMLDVGGKQSYLYSGSNYTGFDYASYLDTYVNSDFFNGDYDAAVTSLLNGMESFFAQGTPSSSYQDYDDPTGWDVPAAETAASSGATRVVVMLVILAVLVYCVLSAMERSRYRTWYGRYGTMASPPVMFTPIFFWHRPGSPWWDHMHHRPPHGPGGPRGPHGPGGPGPRPGPGSRPGGGPRPGGPRPGGSGPRPGNGPRPGGGVGGGRPGGGFGGGHGGGGFGGGGHGGGHGGGGFGGGGHGGGHR